MNRSHNYSSFAEAYHIELQSLLETGQQIPSVQDPLSKASNFGRGDRPWIEKIAVTFTIEEPRSCLALTEHLPIHIPYCFGLLAWSLAGRNDVDTLAYYRRGAYEYSDDQHTLSGAFGHRLYGTQHARDQLAAILQRIERDPTHRRTYAPIIKEEDNFLQSREYPCAAGVQLFLRSGCLTWLTVMRAQQALTVLPYDAFLFMQLHQISASQLGVECGPYIHQAGTFHIYENERHVAEQLVHSPVTPIQLPSWPKGADLVANAAHELIRVEQSLRQAALSGDIDEIDRLAAQRSEFAIVEVAQVILTTFAYRKCGEENHASSDLVDPVLIKLVAIS